MRNQSNQSQDLEGIGWNWNIKYVRGAKVSCGDGGGWNSGTINDIDILDWFISYGITGLVTVAIGS